MASFANPIANICNIPCSFPSHPPAPQSSSTPFPQLNLPAPSQLGASPSTPSHLRLRRPVLPCNLPSVTPVDFVRRAAPAVSFYEVLGVAHNVSLAQIKTAYRQMARRYHPDVCSAQDAPQSTQTFLRVQEAYKVLSDSELRANYDSSLLHACSTQVMEKGLPHTVNSAYGNSCTDQPLNRVSADWKFEWEAQLNRLKERQPSTQSWGARMRRRGFCGF